MAAKKSAAKKPRGAGLHWTPSPTGTVDMINCRKPGCRHHVAAHWCSYGDEDRKLFNAQCGRWAMRHPDAFDDEEHEDDIDLDELAGGADEFRDGA